MKTSLFLEVADNNKETDGSILCYIDSFIDDDKIYVPAIHVDDIGANFVNIDSFNKDKFKKSISEYMSRPKFPLFYNPDYISVLHTKDVKMNASKRYYNNNAYMGVGVYNSTYVIFIDKLGSDYVIVCCSYAIFLASVVFKNGDTIHIKLEKLIAAKYLSIYSYQILWVMANYKETSSSNKHIREVISSLNKSDTKFSVKPFSSLPFVEPIKNNMNTRKMSLDIFDSIYGIDKNAVKHDEMIASLNDRNIFADRVSDMFDSNFNSINCKIHILI